MNDIERLKERSAWVRQQTLLLHKRCPETRIASSLSCVEILSTLFYGGFIRFKSDNPAWPLRDRFIISKGHGSISFYPILADLGFFEKEELLKISKPGALLKAIPDTLIPGYETMNGSLGLGLGVACGVSQALRVSSPTSRVVVMVGDGEMYEGAFWESIMFAGHHSLPNLFVIVDNNGASMLDFCKNIIDLAPLERKFEAFNWKTKRISDGHEISQLTDAFCYLFSSSAAPTVFIADTIKGKGVSSLEGDPLSHIRCIPDYEIDRLVGVSN